MKQSWVLCPICNNKTRTKIREDTELINFPLFCPKMQNRNFNQYKAWKSNYYQRARRKDAEPIIYRLL